MTENKEPQKRINIITLIPAKDEATTIGDILDRLPKYCTPLVVDDGSVDRTAEISLQHGALVVSHRKNRGVGAAFKTGIAVALKEGADIIVTLDADGQMNPEHIPYLLKPILDKCADVVIVTRFKKPMKGMPIIKRIGNKICTSLINILTKEKLTDSACGFRSYTRDAAKKINVFGNFTYTQEVIMDLADKGQKIIEVSLPVLPQRPIGRSRVVRNFFDYGTKSLTIMLRSLRDYNPLFFFGVPGLLSLLGGFALMAYVAVSKLFFDISIFEENTWKLLLGSILLFFGALCMIFALLADIYQRHRKMIEEVLYLLR